VSVGVSRTGKERQALCLCNQGPRSTVNLVMRRFLAKGYCIRTKVRPLQFLDRRPAPYNLGKTSKIRRDFWQLSTLIANISNGSRNRKSEKYMIIYNPSLVGRKNGELWSTNEKNYWRAYWPTQVDIVLGRLLIRPKRCFALKFLHALEIDQAITSFIT